MIIGVHGKAGHGKDEVGRIIKNTLKLKADQDWQIKKFASKLKTSIHHKFPMWFHPQLWEENPDNYRNQILPMFGITRRELLIKEAMAMREIHPDYWVEALMTDYININQKSKGAKRKVITPNWIITDLRFPNELARIIAQNGLCVSVRRPGIPEIESISETALDSSVGADKGLNSVIVNDGTLEDLVISTHHFLKARGLL